PLEQVAGDPNLVAGELVVFGKNLKLPLAHHHLGVDALDVQASRQAQLEMLFNDRAPDRFAMPYAAVVRALRTGEAFDREAHWLLRVGIPDRVFLFEAEPEIIVLVV